MSEQINQIADFLTKNTWAVAFLAAFGFLSAFIGTWLSIASYRDGQKNKEIYKKLFDLAEKNIDKSATEEEIKQKRIQADEISGKIISLQNQIKREIPIEARRAVLQDRLNSSLEILSRYYEDVKSIRLQLENLGASLKIPEDLLKQIEMEIQPKFILKEKIFSVQVGLTIITGLAAILPPFLPEPMSDWVRNLLILFSIPVILELLRLFVLISSTSLATAKYLIRTLYLFDIIAIAIFILLVISLFLVIIFLPSSYSGSLNMKSFTIIFMIFMTSSSFLLCLVPGFIYEKSGVRSIVFSNTSDPSYKRAMEFLDRDIYIISRRISRNINNRLKRSRRRKVK